MSSSICLSVYINYLVIGLSALTRSLAMKAAGIWKRAEEQAARKAKIPIIHAPISFREGYPEISKPFGLLKGVVDAKAFRRGTKGVEIIDKLKPKDGEFVIEKKRLCAFCNNFGPHSSYENSC